MADNNADIDDATAVLTRTALMADKIEVVISVACTPVSDLES